VDETNPGVHRAAGFGAAFGGDGRLDVVGRRALYSVILIMLQAYDPVTDRWTARLLARGPDRGGSGARGPALTADQSGRIYVVGGTAFLGSPFWSYPDTVETLAPLPLS
jgi:hypothetical protein